MSSDQESPHLKYELKRDPAGTASVFIVGPDETLIQVSTRQPRDWGYAHDIAKRIADALNGETAEAETTRLRQFFEKCWDNARDGTDVEGSDVQDWGEQLGLLKPVQATAPCSEGCYCAEYYGEFPATCYRLAWGAALAGETPPDAESQNGTVGETPR